MKGEWGTRGSCRRVRDDRGQVAVLFALLLPMLLALSAVVLDVGNMYVHKKNLQTLVDAGAFAGGTKFVGCSFQFGDPVAANQAIKETALQYAGDTTAKPGDATTSRCRSRETCASSSTAHATGPRVTEWTASDSTTRSTRTGTPSRPATRAARRRST